MADGADDELEYTLLNKRDSLVYQIPPASSASGHKADDWKKCIWRGRLRVVGKGKDVSIKLLDPSSGQLFAQCHIPLGDHQKYVEPVTDSSRYFVLKITNGDRHAFIGMGFEDRNDAMDFKICLSDFKTGETGEINVPSKIVACQDQSLKEGAKIKLNLGGTGITTKKRPVQTNSGGGMGILAPPPPGGVSMSAGRPAGGYAAPAAAPQSTFAAFPTPAAAPATAAADDFFADFGDDFQSAAPSAGASAGFANFQAAAPAAGGFADFQTAAPAAGGFADFQAAAPSTDLAGAFGGLSFDSSPTTAPIAGLGGLSFDMSPTPAAAAQPAAPAMFTPAAVPAAVPAPAPTAPGGDLDPFALAFGISSAANPAPAKAAAPRPGKADPFADLFA